MTTFWPAYPASFQSLRARSRSPGMASAGRFRTRITGKHRRAGAPQAVIVAERGAHVILLLDAEAGRATMRASLNRRLEGVSGSGNTTPGDCRWRQ